ncbi:MAG: class I SAM-dependent methyltransferase [Oscillospiraceae bacterium]|jgi:ubiquinone/menaquinone biosynthesis C-methylase UbiE|nr:class I SAM-dependent methyltransferase [Oscillospiraceae bacterium]
MTNHPGGAALTRRAVRLSGVVPPARALDIGCGDGETVALLRDLGYDAHGVADGAEALPHGDAAFDLALFECVLSCVDDVDAALRESHRVLASGGVLIVSDVYDRADASIDVLKNTLRRNGFEPFLAEDQTAALVTYRAELRESPRETFYRGDAKKLGYALILARKI